MYYYDLYGWLSSDPIEGRSTSVEPMPAEGNLRPNFTGHKWVLMEYAESPEVQSQIDTKTLADRIDALEAEAAELRKLLNV